MSLCSCRSCSTYLSSSSSSSSKWSESSNSYRLVSSSSITTVSSQLDNDQESLVIDNEQWPDPPSVEEKQLKQNIIQDNWCFEKNISLKDQQLNKTSCIVKATMTKEQIHICDSLSSQSKIISGKHISMKVIFNF